MYLKEFWANFRLVPNRRGKIWFLSALPTYFLQRAWHIFGRLSRTEPLVLILSIGRLDTTGHETIHILREALRRNKTVSYVFDHHFESDPAALDRFACELRKLAQEVDCLRLIDLGSRLYGGSSFLHTQRSEVCRLLHFLRQSVLIHRLLLECPIEAVLLANDMHYVPRYTALLSRLLNLRSYTLQTGINEIHQDMIPYYPSFAETFIVWSRYYQEFYRKEYAYPNRVRFRVGGAPKYDGSSIREDFVESKVILVLSNTQKFSRESIQSGNQLFEVFAESVLRLLKDDEINRHYQVIVKLHPRESLEDLYLQTVGWHDDLRGSFVKGELSTLLEHTRATVSLGTTAVFEALMLGIPALIFGQAQNRMTELGPWRPGGPLERTGAVHNVSDYRLLKQSLLLFQPPVTDLGGVIEFRGRSSQAILDMVSKVNRQTLNVEEESQCDLRN